MQSIYSCNSNALRQLNDIDWKWMLALFTFNSVNLIWIELKVGVLIDDRGIKLLAISSLCKLYKQFELLIFYVNSVLAKL